MNNFTFDNLKLLTSLQALVNQCGENAKPFLEKLGSEELTLNEVSQYLNINKDILEAALPDNQKVDAPLALDTLCQLMDMYNVSSTSGISVQNLKQLKSLHCQSTYKNWHDVSENLAMILSSEKYENLKNIQSDGLNKALCKSLLSTDISFTSNQADSDTHTESFKSVEEMNAYLLTDTQCSNLSKTTKLAWTISSIQLYINRCLNGEEKNVINDAKGFSFFSNWDMYNKSYSLWSGLTKLLYEPENYIDPSRRQKQTEAYKNIQQLLSSGPINKNTADEAFFSFLTEFETLATMTTVSGYHDNTSVNMGHSWFVGRTQGTSPHWYWRRVDHAVAIAANLPEYAWTGWEKIDIPINPVSIHALPAIYPVIYNDRLHLIWLESKEWTSKESDGSEKQNTDCIVKMIQRRYDGSWSMPAEATLDNIPEFNKKLPDTFNVYCTVDSSVNKIVIALFNSGNCYGWNLDVNNKWTKIDNQHLIDLKSKHSSAIDIKDYSHNVLAMPFDPSISSSLTNVITLISDDVNSNNWRMQWGNNKYSLASDFPTQLITMMTWGIDAVFSLKDLRKDSVKLKKSLDFSGALGGYYWELFYHIPLLISQHLLQAQDFISSLKWLNYVFNPGGYPSVQNDSSASPRYWNTLPLLEDITWGGVDIQSTDPDVISVNDPMHYKLATLMNMLDLLLARGDASYRLVEKDSLVDAYMWYTQASGILGPEPDILTNTSWMNPTLGNVAVTDYIPQQNQKLREYYKILKSRFYNLRNNLTIDGQPMNLPNYSTPSNPEDIFYSSLNSVSNETTQLPLVNIGIQRFKPSLEIAKGFVIQLSKFSETLQSVIERQDSEAMSQLLQTQAIKLLDISNDMQDKALSEIDSNLQALQVQRDNIALRKKYYDDLFDKNISVPEQQALNLNKSAAGLLLASGLSHIAGSVADLLPNIFGVAAGGIHWGALANGVGAQLSNTAFSLSTTAGVLNETEAYRRRRDEWKLQSDSASNELAQLDKQQDILQTRREAAGFQKKYIQNQQRQVTEQLQFLRTKFTSQALFSWLRNRLSNIFYQFYDVALSASLRAEKAWQWDTLTARKFIRPGSWQSNYLGLFCGEALMLDLTNMESAWLDWKKREIEVTRTVSLSTQLNNAYTKPKEGSVELTGLSDAINKILSEIGKEYSWTALSGYKMAHKLSFNDNDKTLDCAINLAALNIPSDYLNSYGEIRRVKSISVSLPALIGPYQDIQAVLEYSGDQLNKLPLGCTAIAVSHGVNDNGLFQLDFNDPSYLPFEGISLPEPIHDNNGVLTLRFMNAKSDSQKKLLESLNDIVLHIHYTIRKGL